MDKRAIGAVLVQRQGPNGHRSVVLVEFPHNSFNDGEAERLRLEIARLSGGPFGVVNFEWFVDQTTGHQWLGLYPTAQRIAPSLCQRLPSDLFGEQGFNTSWVGFDAVHLLRPIAATKIREQLGQD